MQLGFLPRLRVLHTASHERGQIYVPAVNWLLAFGTLGAVLGFGSSDALASAYGVAVSLLMAITTLLAALVALQWGYNPILVVAVNGFFILIDLIFFAANSAKLFEGGWFPLMLAAGIAFLMLTWRSGALLVHAARGRLKQPEERFFEALEAKPCVRVPGTAAFLTASTSGIPLALEYHLRHNRALHERVLVVSTVATETPYLDAAERVSIVPMRCGFTRVVLRFGFMESPNVPEALLPALGQVPLQGIDPEDITYYLRRETVIPTERLPGMAVWREELFTAMHLNADRAAAYFCIPTHQVVEIGIEIEI
jgi:KUP system potassium uptake protein